MATLDVLNLSWEHKVWIIFIIFFGLTDFFIFFEFPAEAAVYIQNAPFVSDQWIMLAVLLVQFEFEIHSQVILIFVKISLIIIVAILYINLYLLLSNIWFI